ncbi:uncharacterized protein [Anabrus simplex]|uniref:uncharacterized protein n=1 Tax=Anabrus simplex TaxID=316456 RepID=UPI0035A3721D
MEEPHFIKCEPGWLSDREKSYNLEKYVHLPTNHLMIKSEPDNASAKLSIEEANAENVKRELMIDIEDFCEPYSGKWDITSSALQEVQFSSFSTILDNKVTSTGEAEGEVNEARDRMRWKCHMCGRVYKTESLLKKHIMRDMESHTSTSPHTSGGNVISLIMPPVYKKRKGAKQRGQWSTTDLLEAVNKIKKGKISIREAERRYGVPERTIRRRMTTGNMGRPTLGPEGVFGEENEKRLVTHIQKLCSAGFAPDKQTVRRLAYQFAEKLKLGHKFSDKKKMAGPDWLNSFLRRNGELSLQQAEGLSTARALGMNRGSVALFFSLLQDIFAANNLHMMPGNIASMAESRVQLINKTGKVIAMKGCKDMQKVTSSEKGETGTLIACSFADGSFLPPVMILKGTNNKAELEDGLPPGSEVFMNPKSSYISSDLFLRWFKTHYLHQRMPGTNLLILDGHCSHTNSLEFLTLAEENDVILLCLPPHSTHALQPLDRTFFGPFRRYFQLGADTWIRTHPNRKLTRHQMGPLVGRAWEKAASVGNAVIGFKATGIFPFDPNAIPDHFFRISDNVSDIPSTSSSSGSRDDRNDSPELSTSSTSEILSEFPKNNNPSPEPSISKAIEIPKFPNNKNGSPKSSYLKTTETSSKFLQSISPIPGLQKGNKSRKRSAEVLMTPINTKNKQLFCAQKQKGKSASVVDSRLVKNFSSAGIQEECSEDEVDSNKCVECWENYFVTKNKAGWIQCTVCKHWLHETCTIYGEMCGDCGRSKVRQKVLIKKK